MTKSEIIAEYNSLLPEVKKAVEEYKTITGKELDDRHLYYVMSERNMTWGKDNLQEYLTSRKRILENIQYSIKVYNGTEKMKSSKEGLDFIHSLEEKKKSILDKLSDCKRHFVTSLDNLLYSIGLTDWKTVPHDYEPGSPYNYVSIYNITDKWCTMRLSIIRRNGNWTLEPNISLYSGNHDVSQKETQYLQCLAFVTLCDHSEEVHKWMETIVDPLVNRGNDLKNEIDKIDEQLEDPYTAWQESK